MKSLTLSNPLETVETIVSWLKNQLEQQHKTRIVLGVSGGIDSAVALTLATRALGIENVFPVLLPYRDQSVVDGELLINHLSIPAFQRLTINIGKMVDVIVEQLGVSSEDRVRLGNIMARVRMITLFDLAKKLDALVCGTENKSEKYLGYFTRFGDAASDLEPITNLYKTHVREIARELELPSVFLIKAPSAGLWDNQTDETELGFTYEVADQVLWQLIDLQKAPEEIQIEGVSSKTVQLVVKRVQNMAFKQVVPYGCEV